MTLLTLNKPIIGQPDATEDPKIDTALTTIEGWANGNIDATNISAAFQAGLGGVAESSGDFAQAGVVGATDWNGGEGTSIGTGSGAIAYTWGGTAWLPGPSGSLVRTFTANALTNLIPPALPEPGKFMCVGFELTASGTRAVVSVVSGAQKATFAEALAAPPPTTAGKMRIRDVVVKNNAGAYEAPLPTRDRRPWARGFSSIQRLTGLTGIVSVPVIPISSAQLSVRIECSGRPVEVIVTGGVRLFGEGATATVGLFLDGAHLTEVDIQFDGDKVPVAYRTVFTAITAGSHQIQPGAGVTASELAVAAGMTFTVRELVPNANNGTS